MFKNKVLSPSSIGRYVGSRLTKHVIVLTRWLGRSLLALGVCSSRSSTNEWPGMEFTSYGYHSNSGTIYHNSKELPVSAPGFSETDIIGCGVNFVNNSVFFTKNGVFIGPVNAGKKL
ncbi:unnamed protein product, partial [Trichobilharzia regenti]